MPLFLAEISIRSATATAVEHQTLVAEQPAAALDSEDVQTTKGAPEDHSLASDTALSWPMAFFLAETSLRSPRKSVIFII